MKTQHESVKETDSGTELRVASGSDCKKVAGALVKYLQEGNKVSLLAMGAGAVNQAVKAVAVARGMAAPYGWNLSTIPGFVDEVVDGSPRTAMRFYIIVK